MAKSRIRVIQMIPGAANLRPLVEEFSRREGVVTTFSDGALRLLAEMAGEKVEPMALGALARRFAVLCGENPAPIAHRGHVVAALGSACAELADDSPFAGASGRLGLHRAIADTLRELGEHGIGADELGRAGALGAPEGAPRDLSTKLADLARLESEAEDALAELNRTLGRRLFELCLKSKPEPGVKLGRLFVFAGGAHHPLGLKLVKWAVAHGASATVVVHRHAAGGDLFEGAERTLSDLGEGGELVGEGSRLLVNLFGGEAPLANHPKVQITSAADPLSESEWALRGCLARGRAGRSYRRMAIFVRDAASYIPLLEASAKRLEVPISAPRRAPLATNPFARLVEEALDFCASTDVRALGRLASWSYLGIPFGERQTLQEALRSAHGARREQWSRLAEWAKEEPGRKWMVDLLQWRHESLQGAAPLDCWIGRLMDLIRALPILREGNPWPERDSRAQTVLQRSLLEVASIRRIKGGRDLSLHEFVATAKQIWAESDVSVPPSADGVRVVSSAEAIPEVDALFVLGMVEGVFPRRRSEDPILSDFDRAALSQLVGVEVPTSAEVARREREEFYRLCAAPSDELLLSYPQIDENRDNVPAFYLEEVVNAVEAIVRTEHPRSQLCPETPDCLAAADRRLAEAVAAVDRDEPLENRLATSRVLDGLRPADGEALSPRRWRDAHQCGFRFFARERLGLDPSRFPARWNTLIRLPERAGLFTAKDPEAAHVAMQGALDDLVDAMAAEAPDWEVSLLRAGGRRLIEEWVAREFVARKAWPRKADSIRTSVRFGEEGLRSNLPNGLALRGGVSAMSRVGPYKVVSIVESSIPGKSDRKGSEWTDAEKLYYGLHFLAEFDKGTLLGIDVESLSGERVLFLLPRVPAPSVHPMVQHGLMIKGLVDDYQGAVEHFIEDVKRFAREAMRRVVELDATATPGEHCATCDFGELCRRANDFGEEESPFDGL